MPEDILQCEAAGAAQARLLAAWQNLCQTNGLQGLCQELVLADDHEAVCAVHIMGIYSVFESGRDFSEFQFWLASAPAVVDRTQDVSAQGRSALLLQCAIAELLGNGNLLQAAFLLKQLSPLAEEADCDALRICHAATSAYLEILHGRLSVAHAIISDAMHLSPQPEVSMIPKVHLQASRWLVNTLMGQSMAASQSLANIEQHPLFKHLPVSLWLLFMGHQLLSLAWAGTQTDELARCAESMRARCIPQNKHYHRSHLHYGLGAAALLGGQPDTALFHAQAASELGRRCRSRAAERSPLLLEIQAMNDLGRYKEALLLLVRRVPDWRQAGAHLLVSSAAIEEASLLLKLGRVAEARNALGRARHVLPPGESLPHNLRSNRFMTELVSRLDARREPIEHRDTQTCPVQITTFGELRVRINGRTLYDRDWHGNRSKILLKALIVLGGHKIPAERLCDLLWPDTDGDVARNNLKVSLWRLRRLGCRQDETPLPWIAMQHGHVSLVCGLCQVDCIGFEASLQTALASDMPERIAEVLAPITANFLDADDSATWIVQHREHLRRDYLRAVYTLAEMALKHPSKFNPLPLLETALRLAKDDRRCIELQARLQTSTT